MSKKAKVEMTAEAVRNAIQDAKVASMTQLAHQLGYKGSVSSSLTRKFRQLLPGVDGMLAANKTAKGGSVAAAKPKTSEKSKPAKSAKQGKWPHPQPISSTRGESAAGPKTCTSSTQVSASGGP